MIPTAKIILNSTKSLVKTVQDFYSIGYTYITFVSNLLNSIPIFSGIQDLI